MSKNDSSQSARRRPGWPGSVARLLGQMAGAAGRQVDFLTGSRRVSRKRGGKRKPRRQQPSAAEPVAALVPHLVRVLRQYAPQGYRGLGADPEFWTIIEQLHVLKSLRAETRAAGTGKEHGAAPDESAVTAAEVASPAMDEAQRDAPSPVTDPTPGETAKAAEGDVALPIGDEASASGQASDNEVALPIEDPAPTEAAKQESTAAVADPGAAPKASGPTPPSAGAQ